MLDSEICKSQTFESQSWAASILQYHHKTFGALDCYKRDGNSAFREDIINLMKEIYRYTVGSETCLGNDTETDLIVIEVHGSYFGEDDIVWIIRPL